MDHAKESALTCTQRAGSRYLNPSRGGRLHAVTNRRKAFCWSGVKLSSACIHRTIGLLH